MKLIAVLLFCLTSLAAHAQVTLIDGELYVKNDSQIILKNDGLKSRVDMIKVDIKPENTDGEIAILSDLIVHQNLNVYVVNPKNGKLSRIDLDEKSDHYGTVEIVSGLIIKHKNKLYVVNPANGKTKKI